MSFLKYLILGNILYQWVSFENWLGIFYRSGQETPFCPNNCSDKGICQSNICECGAGWMGDDCAKCSEKLFCNGHGICRLSGPNNDVRTCECVIGWLAPNCIGKLISIF